MTKREFLKQLRACLSQLNQADRDQVLLYWSEAIDDRLEAGMTEAEIFAEMESPDIIALRVLSELHNAANVPPVPQTPPVPPQPVTNTHIDALEAERDALELKMSELQEAIVAAQEREQESELDTLEDELDALQDELDAIEDEIEALEDEAETDGFHFNINIPNIKIPEIRIPEIRIPEIKLPDFSDEGSKFKRRHLTAGAATVRQLRVIDHNNGIELEPSPDESIHLRWSENANHKYDVTGNGGVLVLEHQQTNILERMFAASRREKVVVQLPVGFAGAVEISTTNAGIKAERLQLSSAMVLTTKNAKIDLENVTAGQLRATTANAKVALEKVSAEHIELHTSNAPVSLERVTAKVLSAKTSNGPIKMERVDALAVGLHTSNGNISGELMGKAEDYTVESQTSNGKNRNPTRPGGERKLVLKTSNGSIKVEFLG